MKTLIKILLGSIPVGVIAAFIVLGYAQESDIEEYYQVGLSGIKKQYVVDEEIIFSLFLKGYGNECGSYGIRLMKGEIQIDEKSIDIDCDERVSKEFQTVNIDIVTIERVLLETGDYTASGEFTNNNGKKIQDEKHFTVIGN